MEENAYITSIIAGAFYLIASLRLLKLNHRTHERPELLFGLYFGFSGAYYFTFNLPSIFGLESWSIAAEWMIEWIYVLGVFPYLFFLRSVFRPDSTWAGVLVGLCEPIVANRYLLLASFGGFQFLACLADLSFAADISGNQAVSTISDLLLGSTEIASVAVLWLAFFPPPFYTNWITRRAVILPTPMDG